MGAAAVDVIIPTRNRWELLVDAVRSVESQTFGNWHLIIVDDASTDDSLKRVRGLPAGDERIEVVARPDKGGPQAARQTGFECSNAPFVALLDSDDLWEATKLERQLACFASEAQSLPYLGAVLCWHQWIDMRPGGQLARPVGRPREGHGWVSPLISGNMSTPLIRREALRAAGGFLPSSVISLLTCEGQEFYIRLTRSCQFAVIADKLVTCRHHARGDRPTLYNGRRGAEELEYVVGVYADELEEHPDELIELQARVGSRYINAGLRWKGMRHLASAFRGASPGRCLWLLRTYAPFVIKSMVRKPQPPSWAAPYTSILEPSLDEVAIMIPTPPG
jgi:glycosyltransferase involved in cell wall biosynthesis